MQSDPSQDSVSPRASPTDTSAGLLSVFTAVLWLGCVVIGVVGSRWHSWRTASASPPPAMSAEMVKVDISSPSMAAPQPAVDKSADQVEPVAPPPMTPVPVAPAPPPLAALAEFPTERLIDKPVASPEPVTQPVHAIATTAPTTAPAQAGPPAVTHLVYGQGAGAQPAPEYPREAVVAHQQGTAVIRFRVDERGHVTDAAVETATWPILNQAALRAVRDTWQFPAGPVRTYDVPIEFRLSKKGR